MSILAKLFGYKVDPETLHSYRTVIPDRLRFNYETDPDGTYIIQITEIDGKPVEKKKLLITEARKQSDIIPMVNDLIMSYLNVPTELRPYYEQDLSLEGNLGKESVLVKA